MATSPTITPVDTSSFTPAQLSAYNYAASLAPTPPPTTGNSLPGTITSSTFSNQQGVTLPPNNAPMLPSSGIQAQLDTAATTAKGAVDQNTTDLQKALEQQGSLPQRQAQLEDQAGLTAGNQQLNDLNAVDAGYVADLSSIASQNLQGTLQQQGTATSELGRQVNLKDLNYNTIVAQQNVNIKRATNTAMINAVQGRVKSAQDYVQRALDLEFKPLESKIQYLETTLNTNRQNLSQAEQNKLQYAIDQEKQTYQEGIQNKSDVYKVMLEAAKNGADNATLQQIQNTKDPQSAIAAAGTFLQTKEKKQFISGTANQPAGVFDPTTGTFTPMGGSGGSKYPVVDPSAPAQVQNSQTLTSLLGSNTLGQGTKTQVANVLGVITALDSLATANPSGQPITGVNPINTFLNAKAPDFLGGFGLVPFRNMFKQTDSIKNEQSVNAINLKVQQWASGASLTKQQTDQVARLTPTMTDTDANFRTKINGLANFMLGQAQSQLQSEGIPFTPKTVDYFAAANDQYSSFRSQLQPGEILVNRNGQAVAVTPTELLPSDIKL